VAFILPLLPPVPSVTWESSADLPTSNALEFSATLTA
jgi:hypothetical protein